MKVLLTGACGNVGMSALRELMKSNDVRVLELYNPKNSKKLKPYKDEVEIVWGDLRDKKLVDKAVEGVDVVVHVAAIIPPLADEKPEFAESVNVGGTLNILTSMKSQKNEPKIIYTSSISVYGDRRKNPFIKTTDPLNPNPDDEYAKQKIKAENLIINSKLRWSILRLTYVVSPYKLKMDPLMFKMPLDTKIEICHTADVGKALANAVGNKNVWGKIFNIAGGVDCRTTYQEYLKNMAEIFGLGEDFFPKKAFATSNFHCGYMDTMESQSILHYQTITLNDYYQEIKKLYRFKRPFMRMFRYFIKSYILKHSPYYRFAGLQ